MFGGKHRQERLSENDTKECFRTVVLTFCLFLLIHKGSITKPQSYLLLATLAKVFNSDDLSKLAYWITDHVDVVWRSLRPEIIETILSSGKVLPMGAKIGILRVCGAFAHLQEHEHTEQTMSGLMFLVDCIEISDDQADRAINDALQDVRTYQVMSFDRDYLDVYPIIDNAIYRAHLEFHRHYK